MSRLLSLRHSPAPLRLTPRLWYTFGPVVTGPHPSSLAHTTASTSVDKKHFDFKMEFVLTSLYFLIILPLVNIGRLWISGLSPSRNEYIIMSIQKTFGFWYNGFNCLCLLLYLVHYYCITYLNCTYLKINSSVNCTVWIVKRRLLG